MQQRPYFFEMVSSWVSGAVLPVSTKEHVAYLKGSSHRRPSPVWSHRCARAGGGGGRGP
ncbi:hypothetical protein BRADI_4g17391v3 [Brachypodium distachyon]|uniref:Uncharacterized protein n=2 Tax=Brachypodium distachyon TaxID=15368 RepID=A0A2K2CNH1_BRADI|nr:hypothetical protein BRADI_4g17391v3 [Brachypodium distachyon]